MGIYLVSIGGSEWFGEDEEGWAVAATAVNAELVRRGRPPYVDVPEEPAFVRGSGQAFEEKLVPPMAGFLALCEAQLTPEQTETLCGWSVLLPVPLEEDCWVPLEADDPELHLVAGAPQVLALAERLAAAVGLPAEVPQMCDNLDLTNWFLDGTAQELAAVRPGPWGADLDAAFYVALFLRAAQHSIRRGCPLVYS
ncbi:hypothetical protein AB0D08_07725 [Kitasatospora sp. NPDC048540]|uniref:hypothetical protein n=1 Tax=unclassified Kitasatospora TaxID=2633591 RepID=UPI00053AF3C0|nr:hypothetical protein [Kitasatospora sp. MBT63]